MEKKFSSFFIYTGLALSCALLQADEPVTQTNVEKAQTPPPSPEEVRRQLNKAELDFQKAKEMFNPWYTGPLITPSAHIIPPGYINVQPYLYVTDNYGQFDKNGKSRHIPELGQIKLLSAIQFGILKWMDGILVVSGQRNRQRGHHAVNWNDTSLSLGFGLMEETAYRPALLFGVGESFPTGKYQKLNPDKAGVDATGAGAFETTLTFNISKVVWWLYKHPMNIRTSFNYTFPSIAHVRDLNTYGGGEGTAGRVRIGNQFAGDLGYEYSFTQRWVAAIDVVYTYTGKATFRGTNGTDPITGLPNPVGAPFNDQLSLAPALEYNVNANLGFLAGVWFPVWGRNSLNFVSGVFSFTYTF